MFLSVFTYRNMIQLYSLHSIDLAIQRSSHRVNNGIQRFGRVLINEIWVFSDTSSTIKCMNDKEIRIAKLRK